MYNESPKSWTFAILLALFVHALIFFILAFVQRPSHKIRIAVSYPLPAMEVQLSPREALQPIVFFEQIPSDAKLNLRYAQLYEIDDKEEKLLLGSAELHPEKQTAIQFPALTKPGRYIIIIRSEKDSLFSSPYVLDGEWLEEFPTGDGEGGGDFVAPFEILPQKENLLAAYRELEPEKKAPVPVPKEEPPSPPKPSETPPSPPKPVVSKPAKPKKQPQAKKEPQAIVAQSTKPEQEPVPEPSPQSPPKARELVLEEKFRGVLQFKAENINLELYENIENAASAAFNEMDRNVAVDTANDLRQKVQNAYLTSPSIKAGNQGANLHHEKTVAEYIALMHKEIHPRWAETYLVDLHLNPTRHDPRAYGDITAITEIVLDSIGNIHDVRMVRSSGVPEYDNEAILVSWHSSPKLAPPKELRSPNGKAYVHWSFWGDMRQCGTFGVKAFKLEADRKNAIQLRLHAIKKEEERLGIGEAQQHGSPQAVKSAVAPQKIDPLQD
ncbi:MAG: hypothetical protein WC966_09255 [Bradymonadales bacterium]|jgi:outer membrane biosynthesis protein TonB